MRKIFTGMSNFTLSHLPWALFIAVLAPSSNIQLFDGFPFSSPVEYVFVLSLLPFLFFRKYSRLHANLLKRISSRLPIIFVMGTLLVGGMKLSALWLRLSSPIAQAHLVQVFATFVYTHRVCFCHRSLGNIFF
jgi:hypothetical protein